MPQFQKPSLNIAQLLAAAFGAALVTLGVVYAGEHWTHKEPATQTAYGSDPSSCNVLHVQIYGSIVGERSEVPVADTISVGDGYGTTLYPNYTAASDVIYTLETAKANPNIKALIVDVDSFGGDASAGEELALAIKAFGKPSVAVVHGAAASSGYMAASAANTIYALQSSVVGSIGATYSYLNYVEKDKKEGIAYEQLSSGPYKDIFSPDKPLSDAERAIIKRDLDVLEQNFIDLVSQNRSLPRDKVAEIADGSTVLGKAALEKGLVDHLGNWMDARTYVEGLIGEPEVPCWQ